MRYFLLVFGLFLLYKLLRAWYDFRKLKENAEFELLRNDLDIEDKPHNPYNYCRRAYILTEILNFPGAIAYYKKALSVYEEGNEFEVRSESYKEPDKYIKFHNKEEIVNGIKMNIKYCYKPLPWSSNIPKDSSNDWFKYYLIQRFGSERLKF